LILDFVDLSALGLCTLPSLFGAPRDLDLRGGDVSEASRTWQQILFDHPGFELEAGALSLPEIQQRAASFDPLSLQAHADVRAISANAWFSLGRHGLGLHFERKPGHVSEMLVLKRAPRGKKWEVLRDGEPMERFSRFEEAVEAVDYELDQLGRAASASARPDAAWRRAPVAEADSERAPAAANRADALRLEVWQRINGG
jgi:hypothetical protein